MHVPLQIDGISQGLEARTRILHSQLRYLAVLLIGPIHMEQELLSQPASLIRRENEGLANSELASMDGIEERK